MSALRGKRGQTFLQELIAAMDDMPVKRLISQDLRRDGEVCALGVVGAKRGINLETLDPEEPEELARTFGIAHQMIQEIEFMNDEGLGYYCSETPEQRFQRMYAWAKENIKDPS